MVTHLGFQGGTVVKNLPVNAGDLSSVPGSRRPRGGWNDNPLQYSLLENPMDRAAWRAYSPWHQKELDTTEHTTPLHLNPYLWIYCVVFYIFGIMQGPTIAYGRSNHGNLFFFFNRILSMIWPNSGEERCSGFPQYTLPFHRLFCNPCSFKSL